MSINRLRKIVSGGQTGVDRAALDEAIGAGMAHGGWIPAGRRTEDGPLPEEYDMTETPSPGYPERTRRNVRDSDATLIITRGDPTGGTALTIEVAKKLGRPFLVLDIAGNPDISAVAGWLIRHRFRTLNVAGPRESTAPGIYEQSSLVLRRVFGSLRSQ